ncbi:MAG: class I SAM-dependent methyltransferase [Chromatiaceae bacterium]
MNQRQGKPVLAPHPVLSGHYRRAEDRVGYIRRLFDTTAVSYDRINAWMSLNQGEQYRLRAMTAAGLGPGQAVLDVASGTGVLAAHAQEIVGPEGNVVALDPSLAMLGVAAQRGVRRRVSGIAEQLPFPDSRTDFLCMGYALRHVADLRQTFGEFARVLRPGGRLLILEMVPPPTRTGYFLSKLYLKYLVPGIASLVTRSADAHRLMRYYWDTVDQCVCPAVVMEVLRETGFESVERSIQYGILNEYTATWPARGGSR